MNRLGGFSFARAEYCVLTNVVLAFTPNHVA